MARLRQVLSALVLIFALALAGCGSTSSATTDWSATVNLQGDRAVIAVDVPGKTIGQQYHPHLRLDGGPEVMMYSPTYTFKKLKPGKHQVDVVIADPNHNPIEGMQKALSFEVK